jgi:hypothetical protein
LPAPSPNWIDRPVPLSWKSLFSTWLSAVPGSRSMRPERALWCEVRPRNSMCVHELHTYAWLREFLISRPWIVHQDECWVIAHLSAGMPAASSTGRSLR